MYIYTSPPGISLVDGPQYEQLIDAKYLDKSTATDAWRLESYRASGNVSSGVAQQLRCYFVSKCHFPEGAAEVDPATPVDIRQVSDSAFLEKATINTLEIYQEVCLPCDCRSADTLQVMDEALNRCGPTFPAVDWR